MRTGLPRSRLLRKTAERIWTVACILIALASFPALAQTRGAPTPSATPDTARTQAPTPTQTSGSSSKPGVMRINGPCFREGDMLTIEGEKLDELPELAPALSLSGDVLVLDLLSRTDTRFTVRVPLDGRLVGGAEYRLLLADPDNPLVKDETGLALRICPEFAAQPRDSARDLLILANGETVAEIERLLPPGRIREAIDLPSLGETLLVIDTEDAPPGFETMVRERFGPAAVVDTNDELSAARGPRLFAREAIAWPRTGDCLPDARLLKIGLIDGALDRSHDSFRDLALTERVFINDTPDREHATAIAAILVGHAPEMGIEGLLPGATIFSAVVVRPAADGSLRASILASVRALDWVVGERIRLVNFSLGMPRTNEVLRRAILRAYEKGTILFASVGNDGPGRPAAFPASMAEVIAVTAIDAAGRRYERASGNGSSTELAAPGVDVWTASPDDGGAYRTGTSYAVPFVLAVAAQHMRANPSMPESVLARSLVESALPLPPQARASASRLHRPQARCPSG
ncbi:MAG: hypothetical protein EOM26_13485 [Alphaproteobacteria bacterium]|nr:hypothetical protein [Alphaproteobacteria bacterium]